jgi:Protein of unknown function (DUF2612)
MSTLPVLPAPPTLEYYLGLIPSENNQQPKFMATVAARVQPYIDLQTMLYAMIGIFTPNAIGDQLDKVGVWAGANRNLTTPLPNVYFTWGEDGLGWGEGTWLGPNDSEAGLTVLPDDSFQILVKLVIAMNQWDGTVPGAYNIWDTVMGEQFGILIQDNQDTTMLVVFTGLIESVVTKSLIAGGYFNLRPAGVRITEFAQPSVPNTPVFGWGVENDTISGWGTGCWIEPLI